MFGVSCHQCHLMRYGCGSYQQVKVLNHHSHFPQTDFFIDKRVHTFGNGDNLKQMTQLKRQCAILFFSVATHGSVQEFYLGNFRNCTLFHSKHKNVGHHILTSVQQVDTSTGIKEVLHRLKFQDRNYSLCVRIRCNSLSPPWSASLSMLRTMLAEQSRPPPAVMRL